MPRVTLLVLFIFCSLQLHAQDTAKYYQRNEHLFSNCYALVRANTGDKEGTFFQRIFTDDMQVWYGKGIFKEQRRKIVLWFEPVSAADSQMIASVMSPNGTHLLKKTKQLLYKRKNGFVTELMWSKKKRGLFVQRR